MIVGITTRTRLVAASAGPETPVFSTTHHDVEAIRRAGGIPLLLPHLAAEELARAVAGLDALVLTGGGDVDPARYGGAIGPAVYGVDQRRDAFELELVELARARGVPTLAICRGLQLVNVALGGTLVEDLPGRGLDQHGRPGGAAFEASQPVMLAPDSRLAGQLGSEQILVNSIHHQAVDRLGSGLRAIGWAPDGVIEAIESEDPSWPLTAVQWHPEYLAWVGDETALLLYRRFVGGPGRDGVTPAPPAS